MGARETPFKTFKFRDRKISGEGYSTTSVVICMLVKLIVTVCFPLPFSLIVFTIVLQNYEIDFTFFLHKGMNILLELEMELVII